MSRTFFDFACLAFVLLCLCVGYYVLAVGGLVLFCLQSTFTKFDK